MITNNMKVNSLYNNVNSPNFKKVDKLVSVEKINFIRRGGVVYHFSATKRLKEMYIYKGKSQTPELAARRVLGVLVEIENNGTVSSVEIPVGTKFSMVYDAIKALEVYIYGGIGLDIVDVETVFEMEELIQYKDIEQ